MRTESDLLLTKVTIPNQRRRNVSRKRLTAALDMSLQHKLTTVVAPAGYGKTTLLREWAGSAGGKRRSIAWLSLDSHDSSPTRFWPYLATALKIASPALEFDPGCVLRGSDGDGRCLGLDPILNAMSGFPGQLCLVLDDYHEITSAPIHDDLAYFIKHAPDNLHLVISSRSALPIPLSRLRSQRQLLELSARDLAFTSPEVESFLLEVMELSLDGDEIASLSAATEGWIVGLQFAALALRDGEGGGMPQKPFGGNCQTLEYFTEEVLDQLPRDTRGFLLGTSVLGKFSAGLCDAVLHRTNSREILDEIESSRLFIEPIGEDRSWYRYHTLFSNALQAVLEKEDPQSIPKIHRTACAWLWENGYDEHAISHAMEIGDFELAAEILEGYGMEAVTNLHLVELSCWIDRLPAELISRRPNLGICHALASFDLGCFDAIEPKLRFVEAGLEKAQEDGAARSVEEGARAEIAAIRAAVTCVKGEYSTGIALARDVIDGFPDENAIVTGVNQDLAYAYESAWDLEAAADAFERVCQSSLRLGCHRQFVRARCEIARIQKKQGRLEEARESYESALRHAVKTNLGKEWAICPQTGLAEIYVERNNLDAARIWVDEAAELLASKDADAMSWLHIIPVYCRVVNCQLAFGDVDDAVSLSNGFRTVLARLSRLSVQPLGEALDAQVRVWLAAGDLANAKRVLYPKGQHAYGPGTLKTAGRLAIARVQIAEGDFDGALETLHKVESGARSARAVQPLIEALCLEAVALQSSSRRDEGLDVALEALETGRKHGYLRIFSSQGASFKSLLEDLIALEGRRKDGSVPQRYAKAILGTFEQLEKGDLESSPIAARTNYATPNQTEREINRNLYRETCGEIARERALSPRQSEVLLMLAKGRNAKYIQERLCISNHTAKSHIYSIYRKLGIHSQQEVISYVENRLANKIR